MLQAFEVLSSIFLLWYSVLPFQNYEQAGSILLGGLFLWLIALAIFRNRTLFSTDLLFHFCIIFAFHLRATMADGWMTEWFLWEALALWGAVLAITGRLPARSSAPSVFLIITLISPLFLFILNANYSSFPGIAIWTLLVLRTASISFSAESKQPLNIPWYLVAFLMICLVSIPFSLYSWRNIQFFWINCSCVLVYLIFRSCGPENRTAIGSGYLFLATTLGLYVIERDLLVFKGIGAGVFAMRHYILEHPNTLAPLYVIVSAVILNFLQETQNRFLRGFIIFSIVALACLEFLSYSRNGWIAYGMFFLAYAIQIWWKDRKKWVPIFLPAFTGVLLCISFWFPPARIAVKQRVGDLQSVGMRIFNWKQGARSIARYPLFGAGWFNYYSHTGLNHGRQLQDMVVKQSNIPVHDHCLFLDMSEASGVPLGLLFLVITFSHLRRKGVSPALQAGLLGVTVNNILDTASFWLTVYPHLWALLGMLAPSQWRGAVSLKWRDLRALLFLLFIVSSFLIMEDYSLLKSSFYHLRNEDEKAVRSLKPALFCAPIDVTPLEALKDIYLSRKDPDAAELVLERLISLKKDFAPYYTEMGRVQLAKGDYSGSYRSLSKAVSLDPHSALRENTYLHLASLSLKQSRTREFQKYLALSFLYLQPEDQVFPVRALMEEIPEDDLIDITLNFADHQAATKEDWIYGIGNFYSNLMRVRALSAAEKLLEKVLQRKDQLSQPDLDYFSNSLAALYQRENQEQKIQQLLAAVGPETRVLLNARLEILRRDFSRAQQDLRQSLGYYKYSEIADVLSQLYAKSHRHEELRQHYRLLLNLPELLIRDGSLKEKVAESYYLQKDYRDAAEEYHKLSLDRYSDPRAHWWEARMWWLAGDYRRATGANNVLQRMIPSNWFLQNLYRSEIKGSLWQVNIQRTALENYFGGKSWRTGIFEHPFARILFPADRRFTSLRGEASFIWGGWFEETDGVVFSVFNNEGRSLFSYQIDPKNNKNQRQWNSFVGTFPQGEHRVVLETRGGKDDNFDWAMWVIE